MFIIRCLSFIQRCNHKYNVESEVSLSYVGCTVCALSAYCCLDLVGQRGWVVYISGL